MKTQAAGPAKRPATTSAPSPETTSPEDARTIKLIPRGADAKRAKAGSKRERRFALYHDDMTVADYVKAGGRRHDVERDEKAGRISVG